MKYNILKIHHELTKANIPINGVYSNIEIIDGIEKEIIGIHYKDEATEEHKALASNIIENHISYDYREFRVKKYDTKGDQLDYLYKGLKSFINNGEWAEILTWINRIDIVKNKYKKNYDELDEETKLEVDK